MRISFGSDSSGKTKPARVPDRRSEDPSKKPKKIKKAQLLEASGDFFCQENPHAADELLTPKPMKKNRQRPNSANEPGDECRIGVSEIFRVNDELPCMHVNEDTRDSAHVCGHSHDRRKSIVDIFLAHEGNAWHPHALHHKRLFFYGGSVVVMKLMTFLLLVLLPIEAWLTPDILREESEKTLRMTNYLRRGLALEELKRDDLLERAALAKASDMLANQYFAHVSPENKDLDFWLSREKYAYEVAGENLAIGFASAEEMIDAWTKSPSHYANIVDPDYSRIGVSVVVGAFNGSDTVLATQIFASPAESNTQEETELVKAVNVNKSKETVRRDSRKSAIKPPAPTVTLSQTQVAEATNASALTASSTPVPPSTPYIVWPTPGQILNNQALRVRVAGQGADSFHLLAGDNLLATSPALDGSAFFDLNLEDSEYNFRVKATNKGGESSSNLMNFRVDANAPHLIVEKSSVMAIDGSSGDGRLVKVRAYFDSLPSEAVAIVDSYHVKLRPDKEDPLLWLGESMIFSAGDRKGPTVPATIRVSDDAGNQAENDLRWEKTPMSDGLAGQYSFLRQQKGGAIGRILSAANTFYIALLAMLVMIIFTNSWRSWRSLHPRLFFSGGIFALLLLTMLFI